MLEFYGPKLLYDWKSVRPQFEDEQVRFIENCLFMAKETEECQLVMIPFQSFSLVAWPSGKVSLVTKTKTDEEESLEWYCKTKCSKCKRPLIDYMLKAKERGDGYYNFRAFPEIVCNDCVEGHGINKP